VIAALKASSQRGMNVLAIMHQPRCVLLQPHLARITALLHWLETPRLRGKCWML
jgi:hypothetical protein